MEKKDNKEEPIYKIICQKYMSNTEKEMLQEEKQKISHIKLKENNNHIVNTYSSYKHLFESAIKKSIHQDLNHIELFDKNGVWKYHISFDELKKVGCGFMIRGRYPLIEKYAISKENMNDFFGYFSIEQLNDFEHSLDLYFNKNNIVYDGENLISLNANENYSFNSDILRLACGLESYEDFIKDYTNHPLTYYDKAFPKVVQYFKENNMENLMDYGNDSDEGLYHLSSMYQEIMDNLDIKYSNIYTEDGISDGKYLTTISFENGSSIKIDTSAWNGIEVVTQNVETIYETYELLKQKTTGNNAKDEMDFEY